MDLTHVKQVLTYVALAWLAVLVLFGIFVIFVARARERHERDARRRKIVQRDTDEYLDWLEKAVNRDREYGSGVNRMED